MNYIERLSRRNTYVSPDFTLSTPKNAIRGHQVLLTFTIKKEKGVGVREIAMIHISRAEATYVLRKFKKHIDTRRQIA
jgi:hypothetical protein